MHRALSGKNDPADSSSSAGKQCCQLRPGRGGDPLIYEVRHGVFVLESTPSTPLALRPGRRA